MRKTQLEDIKNQWTNTQIAEVESKEEQRILKILNCIKKGRNPDKKAECFMFLILGIEPLPNTINELTNLGRLFGNINEIKYIEIGYPEKSKNGIHQHCIVVVDGTKRFNKQPILKGVNGHLYEIAMMNETLYTKRKGDFLRYLKYIRKTAQDDNKPYAVYINEELLQPKTSELKESIKKPKAIKSIEREKVKESLKPSFFKRMKTKLEERLPEEKFIEVMKYFEDDNDEEYSDYMNEEYTSTKKDNVSDFDRIESATAQIRPKLPDEIINIIQNANMKRNRKNKRRKNHEYCRKQRRTDNIELYRKSPDFF